MDYRLIHEVLFDIVTACHGKRVLGEGDFVEAVLKAVQEKLDRK